MLEWEHYESLLPSILAIPLDQLIEIDFEVFDLCEEAERIYLLSIQDHKQLENWGLTLHSIHLLKTVASATRFAESNYIGNQHQYLQSDYELEKHVALEEVEKLVEALWYSLRHDLEHQIPLQNIREELQKENKNFSVLLNLLLQFTNENLDSLKAIDFDLSILDDVEEIKLRLRKMEEALLENHQMESEIKEIRIRFATYLKQLMDEISSAGFYIFIKDHDHQEEYQIHL